MATKVVNYRGVVIRCMPYLIFLSVGVLLYSSTGRDDSHISYWPAYTLSHYGFIANYNFENVEQSSSIGQVVILALLDLVLPIPIPTIGCLLSILLGLLTIYLISSLTTSLGFNEIEASLVSMLLASSVSFIYWSYSGMETAIVSVLLVAVILEYNRWILRSSFEWKLFLRLILFSIIFLSTRPEIPIVLLFSMMGYLILSVVSSTFYDKISPPTNYRRVFEIVALNVTLTLALVLSRYHFFDSILPQPCSAKFSGISFDKLTSGLFYVYAGLIQVFQSKVLFFLLLYGAYLLLKCSFDPVKGSEYRLVCTVYAAYLLFVIFVGGDWMEGSRFLAPILPFFVLCTLVSAKVIFRKYCSLAIVAIIIIMISQNIIFARTVSGGMPLWIARKNVNEINGYSWFEVSSQAHYRDILFLNHIKPIAEKIIQTKGNVIVLSGQAGMVQYYLSVYFSRKVKFIDRRGLVTRELDAFSKDRKLPRTALGIECSYKIYFSNIELLEERYLIPKPDIVFDLTQNISDLPVDYTVVYRQEGYQESDPRFRGLKVDLGGEVLAVRKDLLPYLGQKF